MSAAVGRPFYAETAEPGSSPACGLRAQPPPVMNYTAVGAVGMGGSGPLEVASIMGTALLPAGPAPLALLQAPLSTNQLPMHLLTSSMIPPPASFSAGQLPKFATASSPQLVPRNESSNALQMYTLAGSLLPAPGTLNAGWHSGPCSRAASPPAWGLSGPHGSSHPFLLAKQEDQQASWSHFTLCYAPSPNGPA